MSNRLAESAWIHRSSWQSSHTLSEKETACTNARKIEYKA